MPPQRLPRTLLDRRHQSHKPDGPLPEKQAAKMTADLTKDEDSFYDEFTMQFFSVDGEL